MRPFACRLGALLVVVLLACACGPSFPSPFTADAMASVGTGKALVFYLHQPGATAAVCDRKNPGPRFLGGRPEDFDALADGLLDGDSPPDLWQRCAMLMLGSVEPAVASSLLDSIVHAYRSAISRKGVETDIAAQARLEALHATLLLRPAGTTPHADAIARDVEALHTALARERLGAVAAKHGRDVEEAIDLDRGLWHGAPLSSAVIAEQTDEALLRRVALRVPDQDLRTEARRRIVQMHVAASTSEDVRAHPKEAEAAVVATGRNPVDLTRHPPTRAWLDEQKAHVKGILVRQNVEKQTVTLLAYEGARPGTQVIASVNLRGTLLMNISGLHEPVTLCALPEALDVTPCILPEDVHPAVPVVYVDTAGLLHFVERVATKDALALVYDTPNLPLPLQVAGKTVATLEWPLFFEKPEELVFTGPPEGRGPDIRVVLERRYASRILFEIAAPQGKLSGVVEASDADSFLIASRGGAGRPGTRGTDGAAGTNGASGSPASCPGSPGGAGGAGGNGGSGTAGGPGGPGGRGGDVVVHVSCVTGDCRGVAGASRRMVRSQGGTGGTGGEGGRGGAGGAGGMGGSGTSCTDSQGHTTYVSGGPSGSRGMDGSPGARGANGPGGQPGKAEFHTE